MKSIFLSYIIPAYNASEFIADMLMSICRQDWQDKMIEVIVVDDGSTDQTANIVKSLQKDNPMIIYARQENGGPSMARNYGLTLARGRYILFVDADDKLTKNASQKILRATADNNRDLYIFGFKLINIKRDKTLTYGSSLSGIKKGSSEDVRKNLSVLYENNLLNQVWNKVFRTDFIKKNKLSFQDYRYGEDRLFTLDAVDSASTIAIENGFIYEYCIRGNDSLISKFYDKKFIVALKVHQMIKKVAKVDSETPEASKESYDYMFIKSVIACIVNFTARSCPYSYREKKKALRQILTHPEVKASLKHTFNRPVSFRVIVKILRSQNATLGLLLAYSITFTDKFMPIIFIRVKHRSDR